MSNDIDISKMSNVALESIIALKGGTELANEAQNELKMRKAQEKAKQKQMAIEESKQILGGVTNPDPVFHQAVERMKSQLPKGDK